MSVLNKVAQYSRYGLVALTFGILSISIHWLLGGFLALFTVATHWDATASYSSEVTFNWQTLFPGFVASVMLGLLLAPRIDKWVQERSKSLRLLTYGSVIALIVLLLEL